MQRYAKGANGQFWGCHPAPDFFGNRHQWPPADHRARRHYLHCEVPNHKHVQVQLNPSLVIILEPDPGFLTEYIILDVNVEDQGPNQGPEVSVFIFISQEIVDDSPQQLQTTATASAKQSSCDSTHWLLSYCDGHGLSKNNTYQHKNGTKPCVLDVAVVKLVLKGPDV